MKKLFLVPVAVFVVVLGFWTAWQIWKQAPNDQDTVNFSIVSGDRAQSIALQLETADLIRSSGLFRLYTRWTGTGDQLRAGNYILPRGAGIAELVEIFSGGLQQTDITVTIPEGYTLAQIGEVMNQKLGISTEDWQAAVTKDYYDPAKGDFSFLQSKPPSVNLEGYLFPDTYRFYPDATAEEVVKKMLEIMGKRLGDLKPTFPERACEGGCPEVETIHELVTLASIIEREVRTDEDRAIVSGIFWNRLRIGMALQADSTVNYVTGKKTPGVSLDDLQIDSPYNTYKYPGLPPGPISNPGIASLIAAANPASNEYYYFLTDDAGRVFYAKTHDEHVANKAAHR